MPGFAVGSKARAGRGGRDQSAGAAGDHLGRQDVPAAAGARGDVGDEEVDVAGGIRAATARAATAADLVEAARIARPGGLELNAAEAAVPIEDEIVAAVFAEGPGDDEAQGSGESDE